ncbi:Ig-like domain-containing protein [Holdemanella sp.]|uniref:Ig-like domain-containing protein n=1 Tax=Holdemanella sp. TaxID=1971762 RepID=UPI0030801F7A
MLKNLKKVAAIVLSFAMAVQFGLADSYYVNAVEEPVEPQQEETTTTAPQEQEEVPTAEEETPQQQEEEAQPAAEEEEQPAAEEEPQPAAEEAQPQPVEQAEVKVSYVKEDGTDLMESVTATYDVGYRLDQDTNVFKEAHEAFEFEYAFVNGNKENKITKDQVKASGLTVTSDMTSLTLVYKEKASTEKPKKANKQEPAKTETTSESDDASDADTTESQETAVQLTEFFVVASQNQVTKGETAQLTLTIKPDNYPNKDVTWSSSNEAIATVDGNGLVTTHEVGTVTITATLKSDPAISSSATIVVNPIKVSKITVNGYGKDYLVKGNTVTLTTTVEPSDAANKSIVWSSSNEEVATVDQNGKVTAVGQGTVSIKAMNDDSGVYGEQVITVYDNTPANYKVHVYVTNENQKTTYTINIPKDGTVVTPASVAQNTTGNGRTLVTKAEIRVLDELGSQPNWANISSKPIVTAFRYYNGKLQYKTTSNSAWATVGSNQRIYDFCNIQYKADETGSYNSTDVKVTIGDWPYGANASTSEIYKTIQIQVYNNETKKNVYDSGVMRYANGSNGNYGKVNFICDTSKYEVVKVERYFSNTSSSNYGSADTVYEGTIPSDLSVQFTNNSYYYYTPTHEHYKFIAYVQAKTIHVKYDANNGTGAPKGTTVKSTEKVTVDSTTRPTREGYIFTGWAYGGKLYQGGESFDAPISDVTFVAQWAKASDVINYTVNDSDMGSVSRSYERIGETVQGNVQGSTAIAKTGCRFVKWVEGTNSEGKAISTDVLFKPTAKGTYMAVFEAVTSDLVVRYVDTAGKDISDRKTKSYKYGESYTEKAKEITGYRLTSDATITGTKGVAGEEIKFIYEAIPVIVTIKGKTDSKEYTGNPQKVEGYDIESIKDDKGNSISGYSKKDVALAEGKTAVATGTDVGTYNMGLTTESFVNTNKSFKNVTFVVQDGSMTITQNTAEVTVTITGSEETKEYNGSEQTLEGFQSTVSGAEKAQIQVSLKAGKTAQAKGTNVGKYSMNLKAEDFEATSDNYSNIKVVVAKDGTLTIDKAKAKVTVKGNKDSKPYNGKNQSVSGYSLVSIDNDLYKESYFTLKEGKGTATRKNAGTTPMGLKSEDFQNRNDNFDVEFVVSEDGSMTITQKSIIPDGPKTPEEKKTGIKVTAPKDTTYSGNEQKKEPVIEDTKTGKTLDKDDYSLSYSDDVTNAGTVTITVTGKGNYTGKFEVTYKILPRKVTLKSEAASKPYDGTALTKPDVKVSGDGFVKGEVSDIKATGSVTTVSEGEVTNTITFTKETDYKDGNYTIFKEEGKLSITPQSIDPGTDPEKPNPDYTGAKVNSPSDEVYDGKEHKWIPTVTDKADKKLKAGTDYTVEYSTKNFKDVGTIDVTITGIGNYSGTVTRTYKITPKSVTVTADNKSKVFGETDPKFTAKVVGTLGNDTVEYTLSRETGEAVGKYEITVKGDKLQGNYTVTYVAGTLTITSQSIDPGTDPEKPNPDYTGAKVNSPSDEVYDGNEHKWIPTVTDKADKKLEAGKDYTVEYSTKNFKDVGTVEVTITGKGNYSGTVKRSYKVTPKEYTVTTESATKTYSGTALTAGGKVEGIVSGETVEFTTTGSQTEVGTSKNTYELVWKSAKATNYTLAKESIGKLTVKAKSIVPDDKDTPESDKTGITVSEPSNSKYDGKEHKEVLTVTDTKTGKELVAGTDYSVTYSSDLVNAGTVKVTVAGLGNYTGSFTKTYKITKRSVTLTSATVSKVYDGSALTNTSITVSGDGFVEGEGASYEVTGTQTSVGNSANAFEYKLNEKTLASNYNITKVVGTLTITAAPAPVTPVTPSTPSTPSSTTSTTPRTPSAPQVTTPVETVEKETTPKAEPKKEEKVEEEYTPKASPQYYWALINLICAILTVLFGLLLLISKRHKDEDDDEDDDETKQQTNNDDEEKEQEKKRGLFTRVLAVLIAIVSVVFFLVTEDLSLPWTWIDQWTIWMVVIGLVQIVVFFVGRKWKNVDNDDDDEEAQQA